MSFRLSPRFIEVCLLAVLAGCRSDNLEPDIPSGTVKPGVPVQALASSDTSTATADALLKTAAKNKNDGTSTTMPVKITVGQGDTTRAIVKFDQAAIAAAVGSGTLTGATLELGVKESGTDAAGNDIDVHRVLKPWTEAGVTWKCGEDLNTANVGADCPTTKWKMSGADMDAFVASRTARAHLSPSQAGTAQFDVTSDVQAFLTGATNHGWLVNAGSATSRALMWSRESASKPRLVLSVTTNETVAEQPPDTVPVWFRHDTSFATAGFLKGVVGVVFQEGATQAQRQVAIDQVGGTVIGGSRYSTGDGVYYVSVSDDGSGTQLAAADSSLMSMAQVEAAFLNHRASQGYLKPKDGAFYEETSWQLSRDSATGFNWALEAIDAPYAWGCNVGDASANVAVIDHAFDSTEVVKNARSPLPPLGQYPGDPRHGNFVANIMAARGNDSAGMTGVMWRAGVQLIEAGARRPLWSELASLIERAAVAGAQVVNFSWYYPWFRAPVPSDTFTVRDNVRSLMPPLRRLKRSGKLPLIVTVAGNDNIDAKWASVPVLRDSFPDHVIVVGASDSLRAREPLSNTGSLVEIYAPGVQVGTLDQAGFPVRVDGTSYAAPYVSGVGGLLMSFDSRLTPPDLRRFILEGADSGQRQVTGTGRYVLNAYQSLKAAARGLGAPICGNRIWQDGDAITVQRKSGIDDVLWHTASGSGTGPETPLQLDKVFHGGHKISYLVAEPPDGGLRVLAFEQGGWQARGIQTGDDTEIPFGATQSALGRSHGGDTATFIRQSIGNGDSQGRPPTATILLRVGTGPTQVLTNLTGFAANFIRDDPVAFPPRGNKLLVPIRPGDGSGPGVTFYAVDLTSRAATELWTLPNALNLITSISEDGSEAIVTYRASPATTCTAEFRSLPGGTLRRTLQLANSLGGSGCGKQATSSIRAGRNY